MVLLRNKWEPDREILLAHWRALAPADVMFTPRKRPQSTSTIAARSIPADSPGDYSTAAGTGDSAAQRRQPYTDQRRRCNTLCVVEHYRRCDRHTTARHRKLLPRRFRIMTKYHRHIDMKSSEVFDWVLSEEHLDRDALSSNTMLRPMRPREPSAINGAPRVHRPQIAR